MGILPELWNRLAYDRLFCYGILTYSIEYYCRAVSKTNWSMLRENSISGWVSYISVSRYFDRYFRDIYFGSRLFSTELGIEAHTERLFFNVWYPYSLTLTQIQSWPFLDPVLRWGIVHDNIMRNFVSFSGISCWVWDLFQFADGI